MEKRDMALLIEVEDELHNMDQALEQLAGHGHASGEFIKLDNVFDVIHRNSHEYYTVESDERYGSDRVIGCGADGRNSENGISGID